MQTIKLVVGPDKTPDIAHRYFLHTIAFFKACLNAPMQESMNENVNLPEDHPEDVAEILRYAYTQRYDQNLEDLSRTF